MEKWLGAAEMFWDDAGIRTSGAKCLGLRLAGRWNKLVLHYDDSETGKGIRNFRTAKTLEVVETKSRDRGTKWV